MIEFLVTVGTFLVIGGVLGIDYVINRNVYTKEK